MSALAALPQVINRQERAVHAKDDILDDNTVIWPTYLSTHLDSRIPRRAIGERRQTIDTLNHDDGTYRHGSKPGQRRYPHICPGLTRVEVNEDTLSPGPCGIL